jgi:hypothetical protein
MSADNKASNNLYISVTRGLVMSDHEYCLNLSQLSVFALGVVDDVVVESLLLVVVALS